jgi:hypothetical protein
MKAMPYLQGGRARAREDNVISTKEELGRAYPYFGIDISMCKMDIIMDAMVHNTPQVKVYCGIMILSMINVYLQQ